MHAEKTELRRWAKALPPPTPGESEIVVRHLTRFIDDLGPDAVLFYLSLPDEVDLDPLAAEFPGIHWAVTRVMARMPLTVHPLESATRVGPLGIRQPPDGAEMVPVEVIDLVLVPGRVFGRDGARLGRGAGHYDRLLPSLREGVPRVGVTVDRFVVDSLPLEDHDVRMTHLATESGVTPV